MPRGYARGLDPKATASIDRLMVAVEEDTLRDIVRRIAAASKIDEHADWQINRLSMMGNSGDDIRKSIQTATGKTIAEMDKLYQDAAQAAYVRDADLYKHEHKLQVPYSENLELQQLVKAISDQTAGTIRNLTRTAGIVTADGRLTPLSEIYGRYIDTKASAVLTGAKDYTQAIREATLELTRSGIRTIDYASGRTNRADVAVRRAILTGYGQMVSQISLSNAAEIGTDLFEVTWHPCARPDHQLWQGRVYTRQQLVSICGYGRIDGLCGANCRHAFYPYVRCVSRRQWSDADLRRLNLEENARREYRGKEYNDYEATQKQRRLETEMRAYQERAALLEEAEGDPNDIAIAKAKLQALKAQYKEFSKLFNLTQQWWRVFSGVPAA